MRPRRFTTKIVSDGNTAAFVVPYGEWAGPTLNGRAQLYYNPSVGSEKGIKLGEMSGGVADSVASLSSFRPVSGYGLLQVCQIRPGEPILCPGTGTSVAATVATFQAVALDAALGGGIRLFFEALGTDHRSRIMYLDSRDGYVGRDFNASGKTICNTLEDYTTGGCIPTVVIAVNGDALARDGNPRLSAARQFKIGYPTRTDWRWGGEPGTFMVITADFDAPCASDAFFNAAYATWGGRRWVLQYDPSGCPKYMPEVQAPMPVHLGAARYKMYFSHNPLRRGATSNPLRDTKPIKIVYADAGLAGDPAHVDFEDWEQVAQAREVHFLWPDGSLLDLAHESQLDDYMIFMPTGNPSLQIMYSNMATPGARELPFIGMAALVNP